MIVSEDVLGAALLAAATELAGFAVVFAADPMSPREALRVLRPTHLLIDCEDGSAADETLLGNALMLGARVVFYGTERAHAPLSHLVARYRVTTIVFPRDVE